VARVLDNCMKFFPCLRRNAGRKYRGCSHGAATSSSSVAGSNDTPRLPLMELFFWLGW